MKSRPGVSIVIPAFEIDKSRPMLQDLLKQDYPDKEIIIVNDNPKIKPSPSILKFFDDNKIKLINNPENLGIPASQNRGIKIAKNEIVIILAMDHFLKSRQWIKEIVDTFESDKEIGSVGCLMKNNDDVWHSYGFWIKLFTFRHRTEKEYGGYRSSFRKEVFRKAGLFDAKSFKYAGDDGDMYYRIKKAGYKTVVLRSEVLHNHDNAHNSLRKVFRKEFHYGIGHGARKAKYGILNRIGWFDFDIRILCLLGFLLGLFVNPLISLIFLIPFLIGTIKQARVAYKRTKWKTGLLLYPVFGIVIFLIQSFGGIKGYIENKFDANNLNVEYLK